MIYNLPDRDCSAKASDGELSIENDGNNKYKQFIDQIAAEINKPPFDRLDFAVVLEPDSLGNSVTNINSAPKCKIAAPGYLSGLSYAVKKLQQKNVALYIDAAHSNWLGWPDNLEPCKTASSSFSLFFSQADSNSVYIAAKLFKQVLDGAGPNAKIRGFATNVSNYNGYNPSTPDVIYGSGPDNPNWSELRYAKALTPYLEAEGLPAHFIIDQGRSGAQGIRLEGGHWCNIRDAG